MSELVLTDREGPVALVTMNRPERLNALNDELIGLVVDALEEADRDDDVRCIVLAGGEKAFAAGADIGQMATASAMDMYALRDRIDAWDRIKNVRTPIVAAVSGYCLGGGNELAMACDLIVSSPTAQFGQPETGVGIIPGAGGTQRLTRAVGKSLAMDVILAGRFLTADEALRAGLVARVADDWLGEAKAVANAIASKAPIATRIAKELVDHADETPLAAGVADERKALYLALRVRGCERGAERVHGEASTGVQGALMAEVETTRDGAVLTITLNRPEVFNAFNAALHAALASALDEAADPEVRAVVITGAGRGFCAGQDLTEFREVADDIRERLESTYHPNIRAIRALEKPVHRRGQRADAPAQASRSQPRATCASPPTTASFVPGFVGIGLVPDSGGSYFIQRLLGTARAFEWMTSNRKLGAAEAKEWGLVNDVVEADGCSGTSPRSPASTRPCRRRRSG